MPTQKKNQQPPLTVKDQIANLKAIGLTIEKESEAEKFLNDVSYFRFVKAFSEGLKVNGSYNGVTFNQLKQLYLFNSNFRHLLFEQIEKVEVNLRCRVANYFSYKYGVLGYKDSNNYKGAVYCTNFLNDISLEITRNARSPFIENFTKNYVNGDIPFYALTEIMSFGTLSKFYKNMHPKDKKAIAQSYGVTYTYLESWFENIAYVRNICAHYGRLYNAKMTKTPRLFTQDKLNTTSTIRIFSTLICLRRLLNRKKNKQWKGFVNKLDALIKKYPYADIKTMDFPLNWKQILLSN